MLRIFEIYKSKQFSAVLAGIDNDQKCLPAVIFKGLKKISKEVMDRTDIVVMVSKGGSMTPELMQQWIRKVCGKETVF